MAEDIAHITHTMEESLPYLPETFSLLNSLPYLS